MTAPALTPFLQSDKRWRFRKVGKGTSTMWGAGCLVCCVTEAARRVGGQPALLPTETNDLGVAADAFTGSNARIPDLAACVKMSALRERRVSVANGDDEMRKAIRRALSPDAGPPWCVILHVRHGGALGAHFLCGFALEADGARVRCTDSAVGRETVIDIGTLEGPATWGASVFRVVSVIPIGPHAGA